MDTSSIPQKQCVQCNQGYPETKEFFRDNPTGTLRAKCRECERQAARDYYDANKPEVLAQKKQHRIENPEHYAEKDRQRYLKNPEKEKARWKTYRINNPEKRKAAMKDWRERNPDAIKAYSAEYYAKHRNRLQVKSRVMYRENRDYYIRIAKIANAKRRSLIEANGGKFTQSDLLKIYEEQNQMCFYCGIRLFWEIPGDIHVDHIHPLSRGGSNWPENLCLACADCNLSKKDKTVDEWTAIRGW